MTKDGNDLRTKVFMQIFLIWVEFSYHGVTDYPWWLRILLIPDISQITSESFAKISNHLGVMFTTNAMNEVFNACFKETKKYAFDGGGNSLGSVFRYDDVQ